MSVIKLHTLNDGLIFDSKPVITSGNINIDSISVTFCGSWEVVGENAEMWAVFYRNENEKLKRKLENGACLIPSEMLLTRGVFYFGIYAENENGDKIKTSKIVEYEVKQGVATEAETESRISAAAQSEYRSHLAYSLEVATGNDYTGKTWDELNNEVKTLGGVGDTSNLATKKELSSQREELEHLIDDKHLQALSYTQTAIGEIDDIALDAQTKANNAEQTVESLKEDVQGLDVQIGALDERVSALEEGGSIGGDIGTDGDGFTLDTTLTQDGTAADAKVVGDKFAYVDDCISDLETSLLEQINGLNTTVTQATEKVDGFEETVNNNTAEVESLQEQYSALEENVTTELNTLDNKIPNNATVDNNTLKIKRGNFDLFSVELPESGSAEVSNITPEQTTFFDEIPSENLLDVSTMQIGLLNTNGRIHTGGSYDSYRYFEQYIPVEVGDEITIQYTDEYSIRKWSKNGDWTFARVVAYGSDKAVLSSLGATTSSTNKVYEYIVPETVAFIRITLSNSLDNYSNVSLLKNAESIIPYTEYGGCSYTLKREYLPKEETAESSVLAFLPEEICCAVGRTIEIYNKQVCPLADKYHFQWDCSVGKALKRKFSITGVEDLVGEYPLTLHIYDDNFIPVYIATSTLKIVKQTTHSFSICTIGDSLTNAKSWLNEVRTLSSNAISFVGTRGAYENLKHEGRSGFRSTSYLEETSYNFENEGVHPFWDSTSKKFSWEYYKANTGINPDVVQIFLGTNDLAGSATPETLANNIKTMVDDIRSNDSDIPIFIVLTICWGNQNGIGVQTSDDGFASQKGRYKYFLDYRTVSGVKALYETLKDYSSLFFVPLTQCHDSEYNFGAVETPVNPRATQTELMPIEAVHPQQQGYEQMADVMYSVYCRAFMS